MRKQAMNHLERLPEAIEHLASLQRRFRGRYTIQTLLAPQEHRELAIVNACQVCLDEAALCFTELVGERCVASIMGYDTGRQSLVTMQYSINAPVERTRDERLKTILPKPRGLAWRVITARKAEVVPDLAAAQGWITGAADWQEFYRSAVICYFSVQDDPAGVLNIDCMKTNVFPPWAVKLARIVAEPIGLAFQMDEFIRQTTVVSQERDGTDGDEEGPK